LKNHETGGHAPGVNRIGVALAPGDQTGCG
jgi:hypothetical protein